MSDYDDYPDWKEDVWCEEDWADFLGCEVDELDYVMENQMD